MRSALSTLEVVRPRDLGDALKRMSASAGDGRLVPMAGGTDLFVYLNAGTPTGTRYLDLWPLRELRGVKVGKAGVSIGALTTFRDLRDHPLIRKRLPTLAAAAAEVGGWQIQNRGTIAGNVANASPAGDSLPVLLSLDAIVRVQSVRGGRAIPFEGLYRGYRDLAIEPDELITGVDVPFPPSGARTFFRKVGTRSAQSISKVVFAGVLGFARDRTVNHARLAYGSVAPITIRARRAEQALLGHRIDAQSAADARTAIATDVVPIDDIRSERQYRIEVAGNVLEQFLRSVAG